MRTPFFLIILAVTLVGLLLLGPSDTVISIADTGILDNEVTSSEADNASATATIIITMYGVAEGHPSWRRF